tara:strand:+ start:1634 stop:2701 length:1068 start_codon:yes stop_codon:yes gene_type:complete
MSATFDSLDDLGCSDSIRARADDGHLARVISTHRGGITVHDGEHEARLTLGRYWYRLPAIERPTIGDWITIDSDGTRVQNIVRRRTLLARVGAGVHAGQQVEEQAIAANIDWLVIVSSCNEEFNASRLERYLAIANNSGIRAAIVLSKADLVSDPEAWLQQTIAIDDSVPVAVVDVRDNDAVRPVRRWFSRGETVSLLGSSGVGKSTLLNTMVGKDAQDTRGIRDVDKKGRHTTTDRSMHLTPEHVIVLDSPGIRELAISDMADSLSDVFDDIEALSNQCRFSDCAHDKEPDCAVQDAIRQGRIESRRLTNYRKLKAEQATHGDSIAEQRTLSRSNRHAYQNLKSGKKKWTKKKR